MPHLPDSRPTSPHLTIYRWPVSMALSILHRITGVALAVGSGLLVLWLWAAAYSGEFYVTLHDFLAGWLGQLMLIGWTAAFFLHLGNGIRHLWWDMGYGFEIHTAERTGWAVLVFTAAMTALTWWCVLG